MKQFWKVLLAEVAGIIGSAASYSLIAVPLLLLLQKITKSPPDSLFGVVFYVFVPLAMITGGAVTGYILEDGSKTKLPKYIILAPGLYMGLLYFGLAVYDIINDTDLTLEFKLRNFRFVSLIAFVLIFTSVLGVFAGQALKKRKQR